jgi:hypothetical protein
MPITYRIDDRQGLVVTTITGNIHETELRAHAAAAMADPKVQACKRVIVDISEWVEVSVDSKVVAELAMASSDVTRAPGRSVAIIAPADMAYGLARVFQGFRAGSHASEMLVFRSRAEAEAWLGVTPTSADT